MTEAVTSAVSSDSLEIPLIDFSTFLSGPPAQRKSTADAILSGFQRAGFIYLRNHGIPRSSIQRTFSQSAAFFARPKAEKDALAWTTPRANRGYSAQGQEKVTDATDPEEIKRIREQEGEDLKETMEIGREGEEGLPNQWPEGDEEWKAWMLGFFQECKGLHVEVMRAIAVGLGIDEGWFDGYCDGGDNTLRLLHYPAVKSEVFKKNTNQVRAGAHTDYGSITLLFQDNRGGLQVLSPNGNFVNATPIEDTIVVNAGDLLARWSNDTIKSTKHRVMEPPNADPNEEMRPARYSIAYFCNPNFEKFIDAIPGTYDDTKVKKYEGVNSGEYLVKRLTATY
ncbi:Non-heme dioxygenase in morphine synthesis N-terminal-containing protein 1 [Elsinoe fawcettii]|nr:Non-heme dioxygenase in morphine synthesis N-terminal-containing protein 1 [Elsinoe fawcettii]